MMTERSGIRDALPCRPVFCSRLSAGGRDVAIAPDRAVWLIENASPGRLCCASHPDHPAAGTGNLPQRNLLQRSLATGLAFSRDTAQGPSPRVLPAG